MGENASQLHAQIDNTRDRMDDTLGAIAQKAEAPSPLGSAIAQRIEAVKDAMPEENRGLNPLIPLLGAAAVGLVIGALVPLSRFERENLGPIGEKLKEQGQARIQESIAGAKEAANQAVTEAVTDAVAKMVAGLTS